MGEIGAMIVSMLAEVAPPTADQTAVRWVLASVGLTALALFVWYLRRWKPRESAPDWDAKVGPWDAKVGPFAQPIIDIAPEDAPRTADEAESDRLIAAVERDMQAERAALVPRWGVAEFVMAVLIYIGVALIGMAMLRQAVPSIAEPGNIGSQIIIMFVDAAIKFIAIGVVIWMIASMYQQRMIPALFPPGTWHGLAERTALAFALGWPLIALLVAPLWQEIIETSTGESPQLQNLVVTLSENRDDVWLWVAAFFAATIVAPIAEEFAFRGLLYVGLRRHAGVVGGAVLSGLLFAGAHFNTFSFVPLWVLGIVLALIYERTRNLTAPIVFHAGFNFITLMLIMAGWNT